MQVDVKATKKAAWFVGGGSLLAVLYLWKRGLGGQGYFFVIFCICFLIVAFDLLVKSDKER